jgi:hypothetical protein
MAAAIHKIACGYSHLPVRSVVLFKGDTDRNHFGANSSYHMFYNRRPGNSANTVELGYIIRGTK